MRNIAWLVLFVTPASALDTSKLKPSGYVNDFARVLDAPSRAQIEAYCANLERLTGAQAAVVTVESLEGDPIEDAANRLFREWGIGKKGKDEGLLLLLAIRDRKQRAEIGYGLEPIIPDAWAGDVLRGIRPILRQGNYGGALGAAIQQFGQRIAGAKGVDLSTGAPRPEFRGSPADRVPWPVIVVAIFVVLALLSSRGSGGGPGNFIAGMILGNLLGGRRRGGWGGGGFGDGGGGGGFGGFGGGDSGGGGASSDW